jgi:superfamily II DNA or RNA helicase
MTLPVGRTDLIPKNYEIKDKRLYVPADFPEFKFTLRPSQQEIYEDVDDNALINAKVSWGKTFTGLAIAGKLGQKTLIVTHTIPLMRQWERETKKVYGFEAGIIGDGHCHYSSPITIGSVQSLERRMDTLNKEFGTIIMDEVHHAPSPTFNKIIDRSYSRYKIGLSGTLIRKDGKHVILKDYFGNKVYIPPKENCMTPTVHAIKTNIYFPDRRDLGWAAKVTMLQESIIYRQTIMNLAKKYAGMGHKVLVVSDRTDFLRNLATNVNGALIIGEVKDRDAEFAKLDSNQTDILCGTQSILSEGISHDPLSCLIMATPINNESLLEQLIGRIVRLCPGKLNPVVVDPIMLGYTVERQFNNRLGHYMKEGFEVEYHSL